MPSSGVVCIRNQADGDCGLDIIQASSPIDAPFVVRDSLGNVLFAINTNGNVITTGRAITNVRTITTSGAAAATDSLILVNANAGPVTLTLVPAAQLAPLPSTSATPLSRNLYIVKIDSSANAVTVNRAGSDTINGGTSLSITSQYSAFELVSDGVSAWYELVTTGSSGVLTGAMILAPTTAGRNTISPTADGVEGYSYKQHSTVNPGPLLQLLDSSNTPWTSIDGFGDLTVSPNGTVNQMFVVIDSVTQSDIVNVFRSGTVNHKAMEVQAQNDADVVLTLKGNSSTQSAAILAATDDLNSLALQVLASSGGGKFVAIGGAVSTITIPNPLLTINGFTHRVVTDATTNAILILDTLYHRSSGTPTVGFGESIDFGGDSSNHTLRRMGRIGSTWKVATDGSTNAQIEIDAALGNSLVQCILCDGTQTVTIPGNIAHTGIAGTNTVGFFAATPVIQQANASQATITSVTDANAKAALQSIYNLLKNYGLAPATA